jgi:aspartyl-tRNA(Asn)/glutamyl-tRNA(Gln) amidotransferase subunit A
METGELTSVEIVRAFLSQIESHDEDIKAFINVHADAALAKSEEIDARRTTGKPVGKLGGLPVAVKDVLCARGELTTCASRMLEEFQSPYDATVVAKLKSADAVLIGKTNMDEFAMGGSCENSAFFPTRNPWNNDCIPGGSSGGSAACVAAGMAPLSIGSDTGGSIRQPAALCGVVGMKPTYGRVSRYGLVAFASSLDQVGPLATTVEDAALLLEVIAGHDPSDSTSIDRDVPAFSESVTRPLEGLRLGVVREHFGEGLDREVEAAVREAIRIYESLGATVVDVSLPHSKYAIATYYIIAPCEASSNLARYDGAHYGYRTDAKQKDKDGDGPLIGMYRETRAGGFGAEVKRRVMLGTYALSAGYYDAYYLKALKVRRLIAQDFVDAFKDVDLIIGPVTPTPAFKVGEKVDDPLSMYLVDLYTVSANLAGIAGISVPCGFSSDRLPIGLQLQAPPLEEERLLRAAHMFQQATDWHRKLAPVVEGAG